MDINIIDGVIKELEESDVTFENVRELACLYIVRTNLGEDKPVVINNNVEKELNDILPRYRDYCDIKRKYQLNEITEDAVIEAVKRLCLEIQEFIDSLYTSTNFYRERRLLLDMIDNLYNKYNNEE